MTSHPALPLQKALIDALKEHEGVTAIVGSRIYDHVPPSPVFPYVVIAADSYGRELWAHECFVDIQYFTKSKGRPAVKTLGAEVIDALDVQLIVDGFDTDEYGLEEANYFQEDTGDTQMGEASFRYLLSASEDLF